MLDKSAKFFWDNFNILFRHFKSFVLLLIIIGSQSLISLHLYLPILKDRGNQCEREKIFSALIEDPTNLDYLFKYANLSILLGDLEAAISVFEQMLIYEPDLPRIRLELGVLYFRLNAYPSAKLYLNSVKNYDAPEEVLKKVDSFLNSILEYEKDYIHQHIFSMGLTRSSNANSGIDQDIIEIAGFPLTVPEGSKPQEILQKISAIRTHSIKISIILVVIKSIMLLLLQIKDSILFIDLILLPL